MAHPRRTSSDDNHGPALAPPRPFFLADVQTNRSSNSSFDTTSLDPASDSDSPPELPTKPAPASRLPTTGVAAPYHSRTHRKRSSMSHAVYAPLSSLDKERDRDEAPGEASKPKPPSRQNSATWDPASLYSDLQAAAALSSSPTPTLFQRTSARPPPSSFTFPFQAYPGNPDPGLSIPGVSRRRASFDSANGQDVSVGFVSQTGSNTSAMGGEVYHPLALSSSRSGSLTDLRKPVAPFMNAGDRDSASSTGSLPRSASSNSLYKASAAANMMPAAVSPGMQEPTTPVTSTIPRNASTHSFRAPFLAPSSRPTSSLWSPPSYNTQLVLNSPSLPATHPSNQPLMSPNASTTALPTTPMFPSSYPHPHALKTAKPLLPSTRLPAPLTKSDKPWLEKTERGARGSYALTLLFVCLGLGAAGMFCWRGVEDVRGRMLDESNLCLVLDEQFTGGGGGAGGLDEGVWTRDVELGGFGNGQFEMTTASEENLYVRDGELWFVPTLTSDSVNNILDGGSYTLPGCTGTVAPVVHTNSTNSTSSNGATSSNGGTNACTAFSSAVRGTAINPVMSARINTKGKKSVRFGRVEVRAKLARGDWLWPAIWMLPEDDAYGPWPASGVIDIMEARGNGIEYGAQGANYVRSGLSYGPLPTVVNQIYGWWSSKRTPYSDKFHTYTLEWDPKFIRVFVDRRTSAMLEVEIGRGRRRSFWDKAGFPLTAPNGSSQVVVTNPYSTNSDSNPDGGTDAAPYDQKFYLVMNLAVGGTSGWFPDGVGGKPWFDESLTAMRDFARAQDEWSKTWPTNVEDRAFRVDYVKMWERC